MFRLSSFLLILLTTGPLLAQTASPMPPDAEGCKDIYVSRLAGYYLLACMRTDFDHYVFAGGTDQETDVEGKFAENRYVQPENATPNSPLKVERNIENALSASGWTILLKGDGYLTAKQIKNGVERWIELSHNEGGDYLLDMIEKAGMVQSAITAEDMAAALNRDGSISLHINFDTGKSTIKPDSQPIIDQIVTTMKGNSALQLSVEGYTDNVGSSQSNKTLSLARAQAVVAAVSGAGVAASRMTAVGHGQDNPVASNDTPDGQAQNRRVVLVKK